MLPRPESGAYACLDLFARPRHARGRLRGRRGVVGLSKHNGHALFYPARFARRRKSDQTGAAVLEEALVERGEIPKNVVISGRRLSANDTAQAILELSLKPQAREVCENRAYLVLTDQIQPRSDHVHRNPRVRSRNLWLLVDSKGRRCVKA